MLQLSTHAAFAQRIYHRAHTGLRHLFRMCTSIWRENANTSGQAYLGPLPRNCRRAKLNSSVCCGDIEEVAVVWLQKL
jgi:hypothetical protein